MDEFLVDPAVYEVAGEDQEHSTIDHRVLVIDHRDKAEILASLVDRDGKTLVFARTRAYAEMLAEQWPWPADLGDLLAAARVLEALRESAATGALVSTNDSRGQLAVALVLAPRRGARALARLDATLVHGAAERIALRSEAALPLAGNAMADALPLFEALAGGAPEVLTMPLSATLALRLQVST